MRTTLAGIGLLCVLSGALAVSRAAWADEITDNAMIAHQRLARLRHAVLTYLNDDPKLSMDSPLHLFPAKVSDPLLFWHPGDNDPPPATIDNAAPNQPNSAQISFIFRTGAVDNLRPDEFVIWDASPMNNGGRFISAITADGLVETIPPSQAPVPTPSTIGQHRLCAIGAELLYTYLNGSDGQLPADLAGLYPYPFSSPRSFWNPGDSDPVPTDITNAAPDAPNSAQVSFAFPAAGMREQDLTPGTILVQDSTPANNAGLGIAVFRYGGVCEFELVGLAGDGDGNARVDLADWARMQRCAQEWNYFDLLQDDACRPFDFDNDQRITARDQAGFIAALAGPGQR